jgi:hypothetical protein
MTGPVTNQKVASILPDLKALNEALDQSVVPANLLHVVLDKLQDMPVDAISQGAHRISNAIYFYEPTPSDRFFSNWKRPKLLRKDLLAQHPPLAWLMLLSSNGYMREAALQLIDEAPRSPFLFAVLVARLNDWVPQVQLAAKTSYEKLKAKLEPETVAAASPYILRRLSLGTRYPEELPSLLRALLLRRDVVAAIANRFLTETSGGLISQFRICLENPEFDEHLLKAARQSKNAGIRREAYRNLLRGYAEKLVGTEFKYTNKIYGEGRWMPVFSQRTIQVTEGLNALIDYGLADTSAKVRRLTADAVVVHRAKLKNVPKLIKMLLSDKNVAVRERGDFLQRTDVNNKPRHEAGVSKAARG